MTSELLGLGLDQDLHAQVDTAILQAREMLAEIYKLAARDLLFSMSIILLVIDQRH